MSDIQVFTQWTPNPNAYKFITSEFVINQGKASFQDLTECEHIPLVKALLGLSSVSQIHLYENVITVTQDGSQDWGELSDSIEVAIEQFLPSHDVAFERNTGRSREHLSAELKEIDAILDRTIRPGLQGDGGDVEVLEYEDHVLKIHYQGACGSCPSALAGTLQAITQFLRDEYDPEIDVVVMPDA